MREGGVGDTTAGETRRAGIQLNGAQGRDLLLSFLLLDFCFWILDFGFDSSLFSGMFGHRWRMKYVSSA